MLSLSSSCSTPPKKINNNPSILTDDEKQTLVEGTPEMTEKEMMHPAAAMEQLHDDKSIVSNNNNKPKSKKSKKSTSSESNGFEKKIRGSALGSLKDPQMTSDTLSHTGSDKKTSSAESDRCENKAVRDKNKKTKTFESSPKIRHLNLNTGNQSRSDEDLKLKDKTIKDISHKVNTNDHDFQGPKLKKNSLDIQSPAPIKRLPKQRSMNGVRSKKSSKQKQDLSESISLPVLQLSSSSVNQYVESWLNKIEPESVPYDDEKNHPEIVPRAVFQIGSDSTDGSEIKSYPEKDSVDVEGPSLEDNADERPTSHPTVQIMCEGEPTEPQRPRGFCKSMPILRVHSEQEDLVRMHKSSENLVPPDPSGISQSTEVRVRSGMKPVLQQLCLSVQSIKQALSPTHLTPLEKEKSSSLPDFSSQLASAFGSPSRALLSFLSLMTLRDGLSVLYKDESHASNTNVCPEALQVMQSLEKISNIKDEDELKASLTSLQSSTSSKLKQSWRDFQEQNVFEESPPLSPRFSEQEFTVEVDLEGEIEDQDKQCSFSMEQLLDELNMPEDLHREISSLVEGEPQYFNQEDVIKHDDTISEILGKEKENEDGSLSGSLEKAADMEEEKENIDQDNDKTNDDITNDQMEPESQEFCLIQAHSPDSESIEEDMGNEDYGIAVPIQSPEGHGSDSSKAEDLETSDNNQMNAENMQERVMHEDSESEDKNGEGNCSPTSEQKITDVAVEEVFEFSDHQDNICEREDSVTPEIIEERDIDVDEEDTIQNIRVTSEQSDASEPEDTNAKHSCSASEAECVPISDRETAELYEYNQYNTVEDCVREEAELSDFEETISDGGHEQENKSISSECNSIHSETSSTHRDTEGECREQTLESSSQEDDQVMSPDVKDADNQEDVPEISEGEGCDPHCNGSPLYGSNDGNSMTPEGEYEKTQQIENGLVEECDIHEVDHENSDVCERVDPDAEPDSYTISNPEVADEDMTGTKPNSSDSEPCKIQTLEEGSLPEKDNSA